MPKNVSITSRYWLAASAKVFVLLDFILFVLVQAQRILISLAFGFYRNLVTCIKPINSLIQLKTAFFTLWAHDFKTLLHYKFRRVHA